MARKRQRRRRKPLLLLFALIVIAAGIGTYVAYGSHSAKTNGAEALA